MNSLKAPLVRQKKAKVGIVGLFLALVILGAATPTQAIVDDVVALAPGENGCSDTEGGDGFGDNHAKCAMSCDEGRVLSISVDSSDDEGRYPASVSGTVECGGGEATCADDEGHCSGGGTSDEGAKVTSSDDGGTCKGKSDELYESQLTVSCSADKASVPPTDPKWCPIYEPVKVCLEWLPPFVQDIIRMILDLIPGDVDPSEYLPGGPPPVPPAEEIIGSLPSVHEIIGQLPLHEVHQILMEVAAKLPLQEVKQILMEILNTEVQHDFEVPEVVEPAQSSRDQDVWNQATAINPLLPWEAATNDSYVWMHFDGSTAIGINCYHGVCEDFTPTLINDGAGFLLATP